MHWKNWSVPAKTRAPCSRARCWWPDAPARGQLDLGAHHAEGADLDVGTDLGAGIDDRGGMDAGHPP